MMDTVSTHSPSSTISAGRHVHEFHLRFSDMDMLGHVNNVKFFGYLEDARMEMLHADPLRTGGQPLVGLVVARHEMDYRRPLLPQVQPVRVETWVAEVGRSSFTLRYEVRDDRNVYAEASSVLVAFDAETNRSRAFTESERAFLDRYHATDPAPGR
ncbi:acyl-CoA thioesterase [Pseudonocardiaceae bacterium YIM PH 21723]|nr:acyl-CoA thioesterase [Pseudonocardiaceae bacterium YIM PH 21723]